MKLPEKYAFIEMHDELEQVLDAIVNTRENLCILGAAGCGKSLTIKLLSDKAVYNHETIVACPTGIAAINASSEGVRAQTLHSLFKLPPLGVIPVDKLNVHDFYKEMFNALDTLIIDEISMVNSDMLTKVDFLLKQYRNGRPVRYIVFGDLSQLAPVVSTPEEKTYLNDAYGSRFFFDTDIYKTMRLIQLTKIFRQKDPVFKEVLNKIRFKTQSEEDLQYLNTRVVDVEEFRSKSFVYIALTNATVNMINNRELYLNSNPTVSYHGEAKYYKDSDKLVPQKLDLKVGTQVMMVANNHQAGYYNGQLGIIKRLHKDKIIVESDNVEYEVEPYTWQKYAYQYDRSTKHIQADVIGTYKQFPIKMGYAITSHKAQGLTLERVYLDLEKRTFASGQLYTALSRVTTLEGLGLARKITAKDNMLSPQIRKFYKKYKID
jgi:ATP-dependent DNA helicase PIF1